jgi:hypothetical protein
VPIALKVVSVDDLDLERLINFRKRENKSGGHFIRDLRHRYVAALSDVAQKLSEVSSASDKIEIERQFALDMKDDLKAMREELRFAGKEGPFSRKSLRWGAWPRPSPLM